MEERVVPPTADRRLQIADCFWLAVVPGSLSPRGHHVARRLPRWAGRGDQTMTRLWAAHRCPTAKRRGKRPDFTPPPRSPLTTNNRAFYHSRESKRLLTH